MGYVEAQGKARPPFAWEEAHRLTHCAKQFILYGIFDPAKATTRRKDICYIYSTVPIVAENKAEKWGSYKSEELCLAWINALIAGQPDAEIGS